MRKNIKKELNNVNLYIPDIKLCADNAAMICASAFYHKKPTSLQNYFKIKADSNLKLFT